jgi:hypothetical protein
MITLLGRLVDGFVYTFGITAPRAEQRRTVSLVLGGAILLAGTAVVVMTIAMIVSTR